MIHFPNEHLDLEYLDTRETVAEACARAGHPLDLVCGGTGRCGQCKILIKNHGITLEVLACQYPVFDEMEILTDAEAHQQILDRHVDFDPLRLDPPVRCFPVSFESLNLQNANAFLGSINAVLPIDLTCGEPDILIAGFEAVRKNPVPIVDVIAAVYETDPSAFIARTGTLLGVTPEIGGIPEYGAAFDVGTTTVVGYLYNLESGDLYATASSKNRQAAYGADVISRIAAAEDGKLAALNDAICETLANLIQELCQKAGALKARQIISVVCCGNTTMLHLLAGVSPKSLGTAPFVSQIDAPIEGPASRWHLDLHPAAQLTLLPPIASYIGSDTSALLAALPRQNETRLVIDLGTNAEIAVGQNGHYTVCSAPCGPALEGDGLTMGMRAAEGAIEKTSYDPGTKQFHCQMIGDPPATGLCGSGVIDTIAALLDSGLLKPDGSFISDEAAAAHPNGTRLTRSGKIRQFVLLTAEENGGADAIVLTQKDIRAIQLAKAAIQTAVDLLLKAAGVSLANIDTIYLAGAFGNYISIPSAQKIGLLPTGQMKIVPVGNGAGSGAIHCLLSLDAKKQTEGMAMQCNVINLTNDTDFNTHLVANTTLSPQ
ncbi:ASKHA domain-containing protein [Pseudoramibacter porci]|uniref:DUF4445 domain-containing protein n=1 Tax=Pseudoramibacter porci TaxID=2606631 RepID=A0A7X2TA13_9FIRM|nr:ASKHA domain-containing protein [Pseudoramibacter porci]MSS19016.1 DUF4445 domain-containing protein [Pseudoramibacter porci]